MYDVLSALSNFISFGPIVNVWEALDDENAEEVTLVDAWITDEDTLTDDVTFPTVIPFAAAPLLTSIFPAVLSDPWVKLYVPPDVFKLTSVVLGNSINVLLSILLNKKILMGNFI